MKIEQDVLDWLLESNQPAVRYRALIDLLNCPASDSQVREAYSAIAKRGWARDILAQQNPAGYWASRKDLYRPKYNATNWRAIVLSDLGLTSRDKRIKRAADLFFEDWLSITKENIFNDEVCIVGNTARFLTRFGYGGDSRVRKLFDHLVEDQKNDGGWHCHESSEGTLDCWEALAAYGALPRQKWTRKIKNSVERGAEFYLEKELFKEGKKYLPWFRFHYPVHYYYDILVGLDVITSLGYAGDKRLSSALRILEQKRLKNGTWTLDVIHPDPKNYAWGKRNLRWKAKPFALEEPRKQSKWITLTALKILKRVQES